VNATLCKLCPNGTISKAGSTDCAACPAGTISVNGTQCKDPSTVEKVQSDQNQPEISEQEGGEGPSKGGNGILYVIGVVAIIALLLYVVSQNNKKSSREIEGDKEIKISLVSRNEQRYDAINA